MSNLVSLENGRVTTSSLIVAQHFNKRHGDVLRAIRNLECSCEFSERNFASAEYKDEQKKPRQYYIITKDGFMFLVMGFTGKEAALWKERFINAFNEMEAKLRNTIKNTPPWEVGEKQLNLFNRDEFMRVREIANRYLADMAEKAKGGKVTPSLEIPDEVLAGIVAMQIWKTCFTFSVDCDGYVSIRPRPDPYESITRAIADPENIGLKDEVIQKVAQACVDTLTRRAQNRNAIVMKLRGVK